LEYANFLIKNERTGDGIALKLPRIKRRKEQHKARARMREKCTERTAKKEQAKEEKHDPKRNKLAGTSARGKRMTEGRGDGRKQGGDGGRGGTEKNAG